MAAGCVPGGTTIPRQLSIDGSADASHAVVRRPGFGAASNGEVGHVACRGDGDALFKGVEPANAPEFALEQGTRLFQDPHVGLAVFQQFGLQVKHAIGRHLLRVPSFEVGATGRFHAIGIVILSGRHGPHVLLQGGHVKEVRKEPLGFFPQAEGLGKRGQGHGKKVQTVDELDAPGNGDAQEFGPVDDLRRDHHLSVQFLKQQVAVVALKIMRDYHERAASGVRHSQVPHPGHEFGHGRKLVALVVHTGLGAHQQVRAMRLPAFLHALAIEKDFDNSLLLGPRSRLVGGGGGAAGGVFAFGPSTIWHVLDETFVVPHVHRVPAIVARLIAAHVTEKGLIALEGASAMPATP